MNQTITTIFLINSVIIDQRKENRDSRPTSQSKTFARIPPPTFIAAVGVG
jgi:hypothetical protein